MDHEIVRRRAKEWVQESPWGWGTAFRLFALGGAPAAEEEPPLQPEWGPLAQSISIRGDLCESRLASLPARCSS